MASRAGMIPLAQAAMKGLPAKNFNLSSVGKRFQSLNQNYIQHSLNKATLARTYSNIYGLGALASVRNSGALSREVVEYATSFREHEEISAEIDEVKTQKDLLNGDNTSENWTIKMLYDGECPLCMREVNMLQERNKDYGTIKFVDISTLDYSPEENAGIEFETAMGRIHAILKDGTVLQNVAAFKRLYEEVGLGWIYAITNYEPFSIFAEALYDIWAKYRLPITGRPPLERVLEEKRQQKLQVNCEVDRCKMKTTPEEAT